MSAPVLLNLLNLMRKRDKMPGKPRILSIFLNMFNMSKHVRSSMHMQLFSEDKCLLFGLKLHELSMVCVNSCSIGSGQTAG